MNYITQYKSFVNSHHLTEGLRMTFGIILPSLVFGFYNNLNTGLVLSIGALLVSITDNPGPVHHRRNGMLVCNFFLFLVTLITGFIVNNEVLFAVFLTVACFFFSFMTIYGSRSATIGTASMIMIVLTIDPRTSLQSPADILIHGAKVAAGGAWYLIYSLTLYNFRPLKLAQQALGDCIEETAVYLELRAKLYGKSQTIDETFKQIMQQQVIVQQKQNDLSELLFKTRSITKDSSIISRSLVMMYLDLTDIFEKIMISHQQYSLLHQYFDETTILEDIEKLGKTLAKELMQLGIAVKSGKSTPVINYIEDEITETQQNINNLRQQYLKPDNIDGFISLRKILENIKEIANRIIIIQQYSTYDSNLVTSSQNVDVSKYIAHQNFSLQLFLTNISFASDSFRHAIRVAIAVLCGFIIAQFFNIGHSYWVLLTIIVILKPAYSLTKKRNFQRLGGTILGVLIGIGILFVTKNSSLLISLIIIFMIGSYSTMRLNYFVTVLFMTPYLVLYYHLLSPAEFYPLLKDRVIDTIVGSVIAFVASYILLPLWEKDKVKQTMLNMLTDMKIYFELLIEEMENNVSDNNKRILFRRKAFIALANLSDSFNRMVNEPESRQTGVAQLHKFVVLNQTFLSYLAGFNNYFKQKNIFSVSDLLEACKEILAMVNNSLELLEGKNAETYKNAKSKNALVKMNNVANELMQKRIIELKDGFSETPTRITLINVKSVVDQLNLLQNVATDICKVTKSYMQLNHRP